jgi:hypothetical protein
MFRALPRVAATFVVLAVCAGIGATPARAEEDAAIAALARLDLERAEAGLPRAALTRTVLFPTAPAAVSGAQRPVEALRPAPTAGFSGIRRPALLPALYATNVALQALDAHSTLTALNRGAREANPVMQPVVGNRSALLAVKAGAAAGTIYFAEKLWRRNRVGAVAMMAVVNGVSAAIVAHNYKVASQMR